MTDEALDHLAHKAFYVAHEAYSINKLKEILYEVRRDALEEAIACCQEVIDDRRQNGHTMVSGKHKTIPKDLAPGLQASGASSAKARIMNKEAAAFKAKLDVMHGIPT